MNIKVGAKSDVGRMRNDNQDAYIAEEPVFAVADGVGGHLGGDVASATAISVIEEAAPDGAGPNQLESILRKVNAAIWRKSQSAPNLRGMATTCTLIVLDDRSAHLAHVGDSRAYLFRAGELSQVTEDHNLVGRMVSEGRLSREEGAHHPQRNIITRALGLDADVDVDLLTLELTDNDRLVICSDGLSSMVDDDALAEILSSEDNPQAAAERLVDAANQAGGEDNITVILIDVVGDGAAAAPRRVPPQTRSTTPVESSGGPQGSGGWGRRLLWALGVLVVIAAGLVAARWFVLNHSWFVGTDAAGIVTIYRGIPDEIAGVSLRETNLRTALNVSSLPGFLRPNVKEGIKVDSLQAARATISNLKQRAKEFREPKPKPSPSHTHHKKKKKR